MSVPFPLDDQLRAIDEGPLDRTGRRPVRWWRSVVAAGVAVVLVAFGLAALLRSSPSVIVERSALSASEGQRLLCGSPGCVPAFYATAGSPSQPGAENNGATAFGVNRTTPSVAPYETWVVAIDGEFRWAVNASAGAVPSARRATSDGVYLSAGHGRYYRFTTPGHGPLRATGHSARRVTLIGTDGRRYVLDLQSAELRPK